MIMPLFYKKMFAIEPTLRPGAEDRSGCRLGRMVWQEFVRKFRLQVRGMCYFFFRSDCLDRDLVEFLELLLCL